MILTKKARVPNGSICAFPQRIVPERSSLVVITAIKLLKVTPLSMRLIITRAVAKETNNNMIFAAGVLGCYATRFPFRGEKFHEGRARTAGALAMLVSFEEARRTKRAKYCGGAAILKMCFWRALRQFRKQILLHRAG